MTFKDDVGFRKTKIKINFPLVFLKYVSNCPTMKLPQTPRRGGRRTPKLALVQARVDDAMKRRIQSFAEMEMLDESDIVRRALAAYMNNRTALAS